MISITKNDVLWIKEALNHLACDYDFISKSPDTTITDIEKSLAFLSTERYKALADKLMEAYNNNDLRIAIKS